MEEVIEDPDSSDLISFEELEYRTVQGKPLWRALTKARRLLTPDGSIDTIPVDDEWDGSSVPWFLQGTFPRWRHPIASREHDWRCRFAKNREERKFADEMFEVRVGVTSWWITKKVGWLGVRLGAFLGIGVQYPHWKNKLGFKSTYSGN